MQDKGTGDMIPLTGITQKDFDDAIPDRGRQGAVLSVGEEVELKGGRFRVHSIGAKMVVLRGLPGTKLTK